MSNSPFEGLDISDILLFPASFCVYLGGAWIYVNRLPERLSPTSGMFGMFLKETNLAF
jgi:hypothetical protein